MKILVTGGAGFIFAPRRRKKRSLLEDLMESVKSFGEIVEL